MKRKPSVVSIVLFIILFILIYFLEQHLHIFANTINSPSGIEAETLHIGSVRTGILDLVF